MSFFDQWMASFPADLQPPEPLVRLVKWLQAQGLTHEGDYAYASLDPAFTNSEVVFELADPDSAQASTQSDDPAVYGRLAEFCRTGGDGSRAALWRDDAGEVRIVHLGSGSGSVMVGVLAPTPVDFLRLLAIGYEELCWPEQHHLTPMAAFVEENGEEDEWDEDTEPPQPPLALRAWLKAEFGVEAPATAAEIVGELPSYASDPDSPDPFYQWLAALSDWSEDEDGDAFDDEDDDPDDEDQP